MRPRTVDVLRLGLGAGALLRPELVNRLGPGYHSIAVRRVVRVLGARYVAQSVGGFALDKAWVHDAGALVDLVHATSMLGLAAVMPAHRRLALLSGAAAASFAVADLREARVDGQTALTATTANSQHDERRR